MSEYPVVKITSEGTTATSVVSVDGVQLQNVRSVTWTCELDENGGHQWTTATVELFDVEVDVVGGLNDVALS